MYHLSHLGCISEDARQRRVELRAYRVRKLAAGIQLKDFADQRIQIQRLQHRRWCLRIVSEIVHHLLHRQHLVDDGIGAARKQCRIASFELLVQLHLQSLGRELYRRQRILDLVRQTARNLGPGDRALPGDHVADVIKHHNVPAGRAHRQLRAAHQQRDLAVG